MNKAEKQFESLSKFKGRDIELFRSSNLKATAEYFTDLAYKQIGNAEAYFELIRFEISDGDHQIYVRYPNTDYFVEMYDGGWGSGIGNMLISNGENIWEDDYKKPFQIYSLDNDLLLTLGRSIVSFNFMKRISFHSKWNKFDILYTTKNYEEIERVLSMNYLKIPDSIRSLEYCYKIEDKVPTYFITDFPKYNFKYDNHRFFIIKDKNIEQLKIKLFERYRDGGTTIIKVIDSKEKEHIFYTPSLFNLTKLNTTWDDNNIIECSTKEKAKLFKRIKRYKNETKNL